MIKKDHAQSKIHEHLKILKKYVSKAKRLHLFRIYAKTSFSNICINFKQMKNDVESSDHQKVGLNALINKHPNN